jgi:hypothetical protein
LVGIAFFRRVIRLVRKKTFQGSSFYGEPFFMDSIDFLGHKPRIVQGKEILL